MLTKFFLYGSLFMGVVPLGMALYHYAFLSKQHKWAAAKIVFHLAIVCMSVFVRFGGSNFFLRYILCFGLAITINFIFVPYFTNPKLRNAFYASTGLYLILLLTDAFVLRGTSDYQNFSFTLFDIWALTIIILYLGQLLRNTRVRRLRNEPMFWIAIGIGTTYFAGLTHSLLSSSSLVVNVKLFFLTHNLSLMGNIAGTILQTIGFWKCRNTSTANETLFRDF